MNLKEVRSEIRHSEKEYKDAIKKLKRWLKDPEQYLRDGCDAGREWEISYASYQQGQIALLKQIERCLSSETNKRAKRL